jgi:hypothetical protein
MILWAAKKEKKKKKSWLAAGSRENKQTQGRGQDKKTKQTQSKSLPSWYRRLTFSSRLAVSNGLETMDFDLRAS